MDFDRLLIVLGALLATALLALPGCGPSGRSGGGASGDDDDASQAEQGVFLWSFEPDAGDGYTIYRGAGFIDRTGAIECDDIPDYYWYWEDPSDCVFRPS